MLDGFTKFDYILVAVLLIFGLRGMARGAIGKLCDFGAWFGAIYGVVWLYPITYRKSAEYLGDGLNAEIVTVVGLLVLFMIGLSLVGYWITHQLRRKIEIPFDRTLGFVWGIMHGTVMVVAILVGIRLVFHVTTPPTWFEAAKSYPWMMRASDIVLAYMPGRLW